MDGDSELYVDEEGLLTGITAIYLLNEDTGDYSKFACRDNMDGDSELYLAEDGATPPAGEGLEFFDIYNNVNNSFTRFRCRDNVDGDSEMYVAEEGLP